MTMRALTWKLSISKLSLSALLLFAACQISEPVAEPAVPAGAAVVETMDAAGYTYLKLESGEWYAVRETELAVGDRVEIDADAMAMKNFTSSTLNRTFPLIYFASGLQKVGGE
jgi:hypothetical protein